jgi:hypothetical protein
MVRCTRQAFGQINFDPVDCMLRVKRERPEASMQHFS